jgi:hypothetical protein
LVGINVPYSVLLDADAHATTAHGAKRTLANTDVD